MRSSLVRKTHISVSLSREQTVTQDVLRARETAAESDKASANLDVKIRSILALRSSL